MALAAATTWEVRTAGNDTNGGAFVTGATGTDYSQSDTNRVATGTNDSTADVVAVGTGVLTSATAAFTAAIVGNIIYLQGGTGALAAGRYQVTVFTNATTITVDRNVAAGTGITMNVGGALLSPGLINNAAPTAAVAGNSVYIKAGTYALTSVTAGTAGGVVSMAVRVYVEGYQTVRGDLGTKPLLQASGIATVTLYSSTIDGSVIVNISVDGANLVATKGFLGGGNIFYMCSALNCTNTGLQGDQDTTFIRCTATGCSTAGSGFATGNCIGCISYVNSVNGFSVGRNNITSSCISYSNTGATTRGFVTNGDGALMRNCVAYANGEAGFRCVSNGGGVMNCIAEANTGFGFVQATSFNPTRMNCATFNNTAGATSGTFVLEFGNVVGTSTFFTNAAGTDFTLNNVAGGGAAARNAGYPGALPLGGTGFLDIGALESQGSTSRPYIIGG